MKTVIITGAAGALGSVVAEKFHQQGDRVIMVDIDEDKLKVLTSKLGNESYGKVVDLTKEQSVEEFATWMADEFKGLDAVVNIAGGFTMGDRIHETDSDTFDLMIDINARSMFLMNKHAIPLLLQQDQGKVVNIAARAALDGGGTMGPYCASKAMVMRLTESMAKEYLDDNINVNAIMPGTIDTERNRQDMPNADFDSWVKPKEIADVILFLTSDAAKAITGVEIGVYGKTL